MVGPNGEKRTGETTANALHDAKTATGETEEVYSPVHACRRHYPAEPTSAYVARFPVGGCLRRYSGGSASELPVSRPAQRSLALRPVCSLSRPWRPVPSKRFRRFVKVAGVNGAS